MFLSEIAADAIRNRLRLEFTRLQLTLSAGNQLCTETGRGSAAPTGDEFTLHFHARHELPPNREFLRSLADAGEDRKLLLNGVESNGNTWHAEAETIEEVRENVRRGFVLTTPELRKVRARSASAAHIRMFFPLHPGQQAARTNAVEQKKRFPPIEFAGLRLDLVVWQERVEVLVIGTCAPEIGAKVLEAMSDVLRTTVYCMYMESQSTEEQTIFIHTRSEAAWLDIDNLSTVKLAARLRELCPSRSSGIAGMTW